ncbi:MAG: hypothetical protein EXS08_09860 [Planctomycetes bacterium]|nr:hypothetical protein [Planctomycetota bacterium]
MLAALLSPLGLAALAAAQGRTDYLNVESPQVKPITVARVGGHDWLLVCNTPDNSVEIWDTDESLPIAARFKKRMRVGLEPVSVKYNSITGKAYTADFLSDSVSVFSLLIEGGTIAARPVMTRYVGDEPMDIAFSSDSQSLFVTHNTSSAFGWRDATTLDPVPLVAPLTDMSRIDLADSDVAPTRALKEPHAVAVFGSSLFVLGFKGGDAAALPPDSFVYDFDLYSRDLGTQTLRQLGTLGTTNFNMAFAASGDLWVVGAEARNLDATATTEAGVAGLATGFVKSMIYRVQGAGTATPTRIARDLNDINGSGAAVAKTAALAQPTDVVVYEPSGGVTKIYFTAFGSDRLGVLTPSASTNPYSWPLTRISVPVFVPPLPALPNPAAGPRGLALKYANVSDFLDPGARLYVLNRLDNSVSIVNPTTDTLLTTFALKLDPTPSHIRQGRKFLYSATLSGNGFDSCASCHMDGRTDALVWKLGTPSVNPLLPYPPGMADGIPVGANFAADKGPMVTQSLQGLLNLEVEPSAQQFFTNAPYHWRGDKTDFLGFNSAFVGLLGAPPVVPGSSNGLTTRDMEAYRTFVNSIHYPPNPAEALERVYSGLPITNPFLADPVDLNDLTGGSAAQRGLLLFHIKPLALCAQRSCVHCHALPEGSNNRGTVASSPDPIESAAMRGLFQKEARFDKDASDSPSLVATGNSGLAHRGTTTSLNGFINRFRIDFPDHLAFTNAGLLEVKKYAREFDWGVAPLVGRTYTFKTTSDPILTGTTLDLFEAQAQIANVGLAVVARIGGQDSGYWLDLTQTTIAYRLEGSAATPLTRAQLLALVVGIRDRLVFIATPLGSERRVASVSGASTVLSGSTPAVLTLQPCPTNTANAPVPTFRNNWDPSPTAFPGNPLPTPFLWGGAPTPEPPFLKSIRMLQRGLVVDGQKRYGIKELRHEAPRRLAVAGNGILPGAVLRLFVPNSATPPSSTGPLTQIPTIEFRLPIHPTNEVLADGRRVWQTAAELEPAVIYEFMLGGPLAQGVPNAINPVTVANLTELPYPAGMFSPHTSNWNYVKVLNPDGVSEGDGGWQRLTLKP